MGWRFYYTKPHFQRTAVSDLFCGSLTQSLPCTVFSLGALVKNNQRKLFNTTVAWGGELELGQAEKQKVEKENLEKETSTGGFENSDVFLGI